MHEYDAIVIGGGPAGSAVSTVLAEHGRNVVILEKEPFPRYRIGESLIPYTYFPLKRIGMIEKLEKSHFPRKYSVQFVGTDGRVSVPFYFFKHTDHECANTWQVVRGEFDTMLLDNAQQKGAKLLGRTAAKELVREGGRVVGVTAQQADGTKLELRAPITIDASGRESFAVMRNNWRVPDPKLKKIAVWSYYKGALRDPGVDEGATTVAYVPERGWFWYIPLPNDVVSVGVVAERDYLYRGERDPEAIFQREVDLQPWVKRHVSVGTKMAPCRVTGDYSYRSKYCAEDGLVLVGDAFAFLDPVFSSGVFIALQSGVMAGDAVEAALKAGDTSAARFADYGEQLCNGIEAMRRLVYGFYDHAFSFGKFFRKYPHLHRDLTDCLIGNLWIDFEPLFTAMKEFAGIPEPVKHGRAKIGEAAEAAAR